MNIKDMLVSAIIKRGIAYEGRNVDVEFKIPTPKDDSGLDTQPITIHFKAEHMSIKIDKGTEGD